MAKEIKMGNINVLAVLDEMDAFRRKHKDDKPATPDWCMRCMEAILAKAAGYNDRMSWTDELIEDPKTAYRKSSDELGVAFNG